MTAWNDIFGTGFVPEWVEEFERDPFKAVSAALWGDFYFGSLNMVDPTDLLIDWAVKIGERNDFIANFDEALAQWIEQTWGREPGPDKRRSATATAIAWIHLSEIVANVESLQKAPRALLASFDERQTYLGPLSQGSSRDPLGRYLFAIARHQTDRTLLPVWWNYCDLLAGIPMYHGQYGIWGLRRLPPTPEEEGSSFPEHVVIGLARLASALNKRTLDNTLSEVKAEAKAEFKRVARFTFAAYPFPELWLKYWSEYVTSHWVSKESLGWMQQVLPVLSGVEPQRRPSARKGTVPADSWGAVSTEIRNLLKKNFEAGKEKASHLIREQLQYAENTGDGKYLCRTLTGFAQVSYRSNPKQAIEWVEMARQWEPWNHYPWNVLVQVLLFDKSKGAQEALSVAWEAVERFPENPAVRNSLAEVLKECGDLEEAEAVYREAVNRFPDDAYSRSGLGKVLADLGRLEEAEAVCRETIRRFPDDAATHNSLGDLLRRVGKLEEAKGLYSKILTRDPNNPFARSGLISVLRLQGNEEAQDQVEQILEQDPSNALMLVQKARILDDQNRMEEADSTFELANKTVSPSEVQPPDPLEDNAESVSPPEGIVEGAERTADAKPSEKDKTPLVRKKIDAGQPVESKEKVEQAGKTDKPTVMPIRKEKARPTASKTQVIIWTSHARFLRRWARRNEIIYKAPRPSDLRSRAEAMLDKVINAKPHNGLARMEKALLLLDWKKFSEAKDFLMHSIELRPTDIALSYALARAEREIALEKQVHIDQVKIETVTSSWKHLRSINPDLLPLENLGEGRAWLAHRDGVVVAKNALDSFQKVRKWMRWHLDYIGNGDKEQRDDPESVRRRYKEHKNFQFREWWSRELQAYLFGSINISDDLRNEHLELISKRLEHPSYALSIDTLEEDFALHLSH